MTHLYLSLLLALLVGCATPQRKIANTTEVIAKVPTASEIFLEGKVGFKKRKFRPLDEYHYGQDLDLSERRPVVNLTGTIYAQKFAKDGYSVFGNFYHHDKFWIVRVPVKGVKRVFMHVAYFAPIVFKKYLGGHTYLRFEMNPETPIEIVAPMPDSETLERLQSLSQDERLAALEAPLELTPEQARFEDIALTAEAQWVKEDKKKKYDIVRGKFGAFTQITRFISMHHRLWTFLSSGDPVNQIELQVEDADKVLQQGLMVSQRDGTSVRYDTLGQNCTTTAFDILRDGTGVQDTRFAPIRKFLQRRIPGLVIPKTRVYGGLKPIRTIDDPSLQKEFKETYDWEVVEKKKEICGPSIIKAHCENSKEAVEAIKGW
jgi:hypothetical protein